MADSPERLSPPPGLPWVVAVGASAGGLQALQSFFSIVQAPSQAAFVVIQHLAPDHRSMMNELLARHTALPVREAVAGDSLLPDHVYLMPPGVLMTLVHDQLVFEPRPQHGVSLPIDQFMRSLARSMPERSIGVVLSGSGSDGSSGASALRAAGGYVMAQRPDTAKFDSMPRSVMSATLVDAVLSPEELAVKVLALTRGHSGRLLSGELVGLETAKPALQRLFESLRERSGIDFGQYKLPTMMRRIERRMAVLGCTSVEVYADMVAQSVDESELLRRELLIPVTGFFRDPAAFDVLAAQLRALLSRPAPLPALRIWCAGCATGEEAYSLAITALEACHAVQRWPGIKVFATDVDQRFLAIGSAGSYPAGAADAMQPERAQSYFNRQNDRLVVKPELRQMVLFARHNLLEDAPFTKMDLVVCRNTLIYFQAEAQERVMRRLQYALNPDGLMFLGSSESLGSLQVDFQVLDGTHKLYRLLRPVLTSLAVRDGFGHTAALRRARTPERLGARATVPSVVEAGQRELMQHYLPLSLLVTAQRQLLHAWGSTERYLRLPQGQANLDAIRLLPPRLGAVVGHALQRVVREGTPHVSTPLWLDLTGQRVNVRVVARPLPAEDGAEPCVLISFEELPSETQPVNAERAMNEAELDRLASLERELGESRLTLQANIEELEAANEELQAANEELMSSNEELQSTNEELQSVNEELYTVNAEYNAKLELVSALHADLEGMSQATGIATLFIDATLSLVRFTPEATLLFRLRPDDIGRSIADFKCLLDYPELMDDLQRALAGSHLIERELSGSGQRRYLARVVGYGDVLGHSRRAVLSLIEVTRLHDAERLQRLIDSLPEHVALLDNLGTIIQVNQAWSDFARRNGGDGATTGVGCNYLALLARSDSPNGHEVLRGLQQVIDGKIPSLRITYPCHSPDEERWFVMHASTLRGGGAGADAGGGAVVTHLDVTPWVRAAGPQSDKGGD